jgi:hypothetical protein
LPSLCAKCSYWIRTQRAHRRRKTGEQRDECQPQWRRDSARTLGGVAASGGVIQIPIAKNADELPESVALDSVTPSFFTVFGVTPLLGGVPDQRNVVGPGQLTGGIAVSERLWRVRFGADPSIVGQSIRIGSPPRQSVNVGIATALFGFRADRSHNITS